MMKKLANASGNPSTLSQCWAGPIYAAFICGVVMIYFFTTHSYERAFPVFFSFLPAAFYYGAAVQAKSEKQIRELQLRIVQLESQAKQPSV